MTAWLKLVAMVVGGMIGFLLLMLALGLILESVRALLRGIRRLGSKLVGGSEHD